MAGMKLTRRELAAALVSAAAAAQTPETPGSKPPRAAEDLTQAAAAIRRVKVGYEVEPAFTFHAQ